MIRRLICACVGAVCVGIMTIATHVIAKPPDLPEDGTFTAAPDTSPSDQLFHWWSIDRLFEAAKEHLQSVGGDDVLKDVPRPIPGPEGSGGPIYDREWFGWIIAQWAVRQVVSKPPAPVLVESFIEYSEPQKLISGLIPAGKPTNDLNFSIALATELLPMPLEDAEVTCPYLRQQVTDRHACQLADPEIGRDVLDNLKRLEEADNLLELAKELASDGFLTEAMACCESAAELCPGSQCAARASDTMLELALGSLPSTKESEEAAEAQPDETGQQVSEPGAELMVSGLMKACHLLMNQGLQHQAAELARQAYALDPERVQADPLIYKMHLLAESPETKPAGASEESEPPTCPYCPSTSKPIREIVPVKKKKTADDTSLIMPPLIESMPFEIATNSDGELRVDADCPLGGNVYHLHYAHGSLSIWKTPDDSQTKP